MRGVVVFLFCMASGACLGVLTGIAMAAYSAADIAALTGGFVGAVYGTMGSVPFLLHKNHSNIFAVLVLCFVIAVPVAILSGYTANPTFAAVLITVTILATFVVSIRKGANNENHPLEIRSTYIAALACVLIAGTIATYHYRSDTLPNGIGSLTEMMGNNDQAIHLAAAHKLKRLYGKEPFLSAITHATPESEIEPPTFWASLKDKKFKRR